MFKIHYVGKRLYSIEKFEAEAKKIGVSRAIPIFLLGEKLKFGDMILLARYKFKEWRIVDVEKEDSKKFGDAEIFGYFIIDGLNLPTEITEKILPNLDVVSVDTPKTPILVSRECGEYVVMSSVQITNSLDEVVDEIKKIGKTKIFITGRYFPIEPHIFIQDMTFSRHILEIEIDDFVDKSVDLTEKQIQFIDKYRQIRYITKKGIVYRSK